MVYHYINLVDWEQFINFDKKHNRYLVDSRSLALLMSILSKSFEYLPGIIACPKQISNNEKNLFLLLPSQIDTSWPNLILPEIQIEDIPEFARKLVGSLPKNKTLMLGISSPKQNLLAIELQKLGYSGDIHCFGAALLPSLSETTELVSRWHILFFLKHHPRRTLFKMLKTIKGSLRLIIHSQDRNKFFNLFD